MGRQHKFVDPTSSDILCGAGYDTCHHKGNEIFRLVLSKHFETYYHATNKISKIKASRAILSELVASGARFLKKDGNRDRWLVADIKVGKDKISHALRSLKEARQKKDECQDIISTPQQNFTAKYQKVCEHNTSEYNKKHHASMNVHKNYDYSPLEINIESNDSLDSLKPWKMCNSVQIGQKRHHDDSMALDAREKSRNTFLCSPVIDSKETKKNDWQFSDTVDTLIESSHSKRARLSSWKCYSKSDSSFSDYPTRVHHENFAQDKWENLNQRHTGSIVNDEFITPLRSRSRYESVSTTLSTLQPSSALSSRRSSPEFPFLKGDVIDSGSGKVSHNLQDPSKFTEISHHMLRPGRAAGNYFHSYDYERVDTAKQYKSQIYANPKAFRNKPFSEGVNRADVSMQQSMSRLVTFPRYHSGFDGQYSYPSYDSRVYPPVSENYYPSYNHYSHPYANRYYHPPSYPSEMDHLEMQMTHSSSEGHNYNDDSTQRGVEYPNKEPAFPKRFVP
jgi:hypothetical protein